VKASSSARLAIAALLALSACERASEAPVDAPPSPETPPVQRAPAPPPVLDRAGLIAAGREAQARYAAGLEPDGRALAGRKLQVVTPFGCAGPAEDLESVGAGWRYDADRKRLQAVVRPTDLLRWLVLPADSEPTLERADAFWLPYSWLAVPACPVRREEAADTSAPEAPTLGVLAFRLSGQSRSGATSAYEITRRVDPEAAPQAWRGLRRVLEGRVGALPDGRVWSCSAPDPERAPVCLLAADLDRVAIVDPTTGEALGEWSRGPT
jgi:hypothetical protein